MAAGGDTRIIRIILEGSDRTRSATRSAKSSLEDLRQNSLKLGLALGAVSVAVNKTVADSVRRFAEFQHAFREVMTIIPRGMDVAAGMERQVLSLGWSFQSASKDAKALYWAISSGIPAGAQATKFLAETQKLAVAGITDTYTAVDILTSVINAYGASASEATRISDVLFTTVRLGKTVFPEIAAYMGQMLPFASQLDIQLEEVAAAVVALTRTGLSMQQAAIYVKNAYRLMIAPHKEAIDLARAYGIEMNATAVRSKGFTAVLDDIREKVGDNAEALATLFGNLRAATAILGLVGNASEQYSMALFEMGKAAGATEEAYKKMADTLQHRTARLSADFDRALVMVGSRFEPALKLVVGAAHLAVKAFAALPPTFQTIVVYGTALVGGLTALAVGAALLVAGVTAILPALISLNMALGAVSGVVIALKLGMMALPWAAFIAGAYAAVTQITKLTLAIDDFLRAQKEANDAARTAEQNLANLRQKVNELGKQYGLYAISQKQVLELSRILMEAKRQDITFTEEQVSWIDRYLQTLDRSTSVAKRMQEHWGGLIAKMFGQVTDAETEAAIRAELMWLEYKDQLRTITPLWAEMEAAMQKWFATHAETILAGAESERQAKAELIEIAKTYKLTHEQAIDAATEALERHKSKIDEVQDSSSDLTKQWAEIITLWTEGSAAYHFKMMELKELWTELSGEAEAGRTTWAAVYEELNQWADAHGIKLDAILEKIKEWIRLEGERPSPAPPAGEEGTAPAGMAPGMEVGGEGLGLQSQVAYWQEVLTQWDAFWQGMGGRTEEGLNMLKEMYASYNEADRERLGMMFEERITILSNLLDAQIAAFDAELEAQGVYANTSLEIERERLKKLAEMLKKALAEKLNTIKNTENAATQQTQQFMGAMYSAWQSGLSATKDATNKWGAFLQGFYKSLMSSVLKMVLNMITQKISAGATETAATQAQSMVKIGAYGGEATAAVWSWAAAIPYIGAAIAAALIALIMAQINKSRGMASGGAFAGGRIEGSFGAGDVVPMLTRPNETVLPPQLSEALLDVLTTPVGSGVGEGPSPESVVGADEARRTTDTTEIHIHGPIQVLNRDMALDFMEQINGLVEREGYRLVASEVAAQA